ncbi:hypothetical protein [Hymenobacter baengnokdamensis]|uniref:hypothetical protein n=1 Tax=Hymenobacter baengnokdamensis TaxID=2615203 RepID=UPI00124937F2|nr:hypothetical protein [Hymenobacter baengnokdamensis]
MLRRFLLPLLGFAFLATEAASAQTQPTASPVSKPTASLYAHPAARPRVLTAREQRAAEAAAKAAALAAPAPAVAGPTASANWNGWSNEPLPQSTSQAQDIGNGQHRPTLNLSVAPGMPINQVTHGVSTDYDGHPIYRAAANTTLPAGR